MNQNPQIGPPKHSNLPKMLLRGETTMRDHPLYILHADSSDAFERTGERARLDQYMTRVSSTMSACARRRVSRQIARGLDILGREAINLGVHDLATFEIRLKNTRFDAMGYPSSIKQTLQNAVRHLHVAAREGSQADLRRVLHIKRRGPNMRTDAEALPVVPKRPSASARKGAASRVGALHCPAAEQNGKIRVRSGVTRMPQDPTMADLDGVIDRLADLQQKIGAWDAQTERQVIGMLLETFSDAAVLQLLATVPGGYRQPVADPDAIPAQPSVGDVARRVLLDLLVSRRSHPPTP